MKRVALLVLFTALLVHLSAFTAVAGSKKKEAAAPKAPEAAAPAVPAGGALDKYLAGLADSMTLNPDGEKYGTVPFSHRAHATMSGVTCGTCHHNVKGDAKPEKCQKCHNVRGEANEEGKKQTAVHNTKLGFPPAAGQKEVSCLGCHKSPAAATLAAGKEAPTKCTACHKEKGG